MPLQFITQEDESNCGAFAVAYYHWLTAEEQTTVQTQIDDVEAITGQILFDTDAPIDGLEEYCDPVKMIKYIKDSLHIAEARIKFYSGGAGNPVDGLLLAMLGAASEDHPESEGNQIQAWLDSGLVQRAMVPGAWTGYLLSLGYAFSRSNLQSEAPLPLPALQNPAAIHYALVKRTADGAEVMNSWDGHFLPAAGYLANTALLKTGPDAENEESPNYNRLQFLNAGILITN